VLHAWRDGLGINTENIYFHGFLTERLVVRRKGENEQKYTGREL
jgi:hypothetical protein